MERKVIQYIDSAEREIQACMAFNAQYPNLASRYVCLTAPPTRVFGSDILKPFMTINLSSNPKAKSVYTCPIFPVLLVYRRLSAALSLPRRLPESHGLSPPP